MVKHNGLTVEVISQPRSLLTCSTPTSTSDRSSALVVQQPFCVNAAAQAPAFALRIGSEPTDRTIRVHVTVAVNAVPVSWAPNTHHYSCLLQSKGLYDGNWRDRGLWHEVLLPIPNLAALAQHTSNQLTLQVHFYETVAGVVSMFDNPDGPLLQAITLHLVQQQPQQQPLPLQPTTVTNSLLGQKRPEQSFGYDQKAMFFKRRRTCSSENIAWASPSTTTTATTNGAASGEMIMG